MKIKKKAPTREPRKPGGPVRAIKRSTLDLILNAGKGALPNEFGGVLRAYDGVVTEVMVLPGTEQGNAAAIFKLYMLPADPSVVGTAHSHPSGNYWPSGADLELFDRFGHVHIICCVPFSRYDWHAYDGRGWHRQLEVID